MHSFYICLPSRPLFSFLRRFSLHAVGGNRGREKKRSFYHANFPRQICEFKKKEKPSFVRRLRNDRETVQRFFLARKLPPPPINRVSFSSKRTPPTRALATLSFVAQCRPIPCAIVCYPEIARFLHAFVLELERPRVERESMTKRVTRVY